MATFLSLMRAFLRTLLAAWLAIGALWVFYLVRSLV